MCNWNVYFTSFPSDTQNATTCQSYSPCNMTWWSRKYKQFHTPFIFCFCKYTKDTYQANRAFMQGITIHEAYSERDTAYIFASMHTLALRAFTLHAVVVFLLLGDGGSSSDGPREAPQSARLVQYLWGLAMFNSASLMSGLCLTCVDASQWYAWWIRSTVLKWHTFI